MSQNAVNPHRLQLCTALKQTPGPGLDPHLLIKGYILLFRSQRQSDVLALDRQKKRDLQSPGFNLGSRTLKTNPNREYIHTGSSMVCH